MLRHKGEILRFEGVAVINTHEEDDASKISDVFVDQSVEWKPKWGSEWRNVVPIERDGQEAHTLVSRSSAEEVGEYGTVLVGEAEDRHSLEDSEDVLMNPIS